MERKRRYIAHYPSCGGGIMPPETNQRRDKADSGHVYALGAIHALPHTSESALEFSGDHVLKRNNI